MFASCRFNERYRVKGHLAGGAHGIILWAVDRTINQERTDTPNGDDARDNNPLRSQFAIKRIFIRNRVVPVSVVREIKSLQFLAGHSNIIQLMEVCAFSSSINLIFPLLPLNLATLIYEHSLSLSQVSIYLRMAVEGVAHLHRQGVMHRDLKPSNMLIDWGGVLKLCDFGQARAYQSDAGELSYQVCTRWYRAPELLYGSTSYGFDVDIWSLGCVLGEMLLEWPLFKGENDIEQLGLVVKALGSPPQGEWTDRCPDYNKIQFLSSDDNEHCEDDSWPWEENGEEEGQSIALPKWIRCFATTNVRRCPLRALSLLASTCRYTDRLTAEQMLMHPFLQHIHINNGQVGLGNTSSILGDRTFDRFLIKAKSIKHLSGPPRNGEAKIETRNKN